MARSTTSNVASLVVVRHGESEWNVLGKWQGRADTQLTESGRAQARDAAEHISRNAFAFERVVASSLRRAHDTAAIIAEHLGLAAPVLDDRLVETDVGPWEGLREHEIEKAWPNYLRDRRTPPDFEPPEEVFARATTALCELAQSRARVLVVSHSGVIRTVRRRLNVHDRRLRNLEGCSFGLDAESRLVAGDYVTLVAKSRPVTNDAV
jgi:probable phosphoglycerate mutase